MSDFYERALAANGDYGTLALDKALTDELLDILRRDAESEHNELRRKLEEVEAEKAQLLADYPDACDKFQAQLRATVAKLQAAEAELQRERQKALGWKIEASDYRDLKRALKRIHDDSYTLVLASGTDYDFTVEHIIQAAAELDQKRAAATEGQAAPAAVELPGGKGPDYVTRAKLAAALRRGAMSWLPEAAPLYADAQALADVRTLDDWAAPGTGRNVEMASGADHQACYLHGWDGEVVHKAVGATLPEARAKAAAWVRKHR